MKYISILRGINVSGQKLIKMENLRSLYEQLGFKAVVTYLQSGNVVFESKKAVLSKLETQISDAIKKEFSFDVPVLVLTEEKLASVIAENPFLKNKNKDDAFFHVTFLKSGSAINNQKAIEEKKLPGEEIAFGDEVIYLYCPNGYGKTKLNNNFIETKLKTEATTRNWKTVNELYKLIIDSKL